MTGLQTFKVSSVEEPSRGASTLTPGTERSARSEIRPSETLVRYESISKSYDGRTFAIDEFSLDIVAGEFLTMLGPSGSGKTTLLMMLAGFEVPTKGRILVRERPIQDTPPYRRNIGMVFQNYALFPHMTVAENIAYPLKVRRMPRAEISRRVEQALALVQLGALGARRPAQMSGGQQQRVALARALCFDPELILMDEPLGALDKMLREEMQYELKKLHNRVGVTIVYVTHDQSEAMVMSDRVAILRNGALQQIATPKALYETPENAFVAGFIGENNRLEGRVQSISRGQCTVEIQGCGIVPCRLGDIREDDGNAVVTVRPERIQIRRSDPAVKNSLSAVVSDLTYLGEAYRVELVLSSGASLLAKIPNSSDVEYLERGIEVEVAWNADEAIAFRPDQP
jgi:putative spermidine/putrescine transport system ATP-binding protein